jgi:dihydrofolate reductase
MHANPVTIIVAVARNGVIGVDNRLPWRLPADLKRFKALTTGHAVIMGRKTWESLPAKFRPLPDRLNIVVTRTADYRAEGATVVHSLEQAIAAAGARAAFVIGGAEIYAQALPLATRLEVTEVDVSVEGDACFPSIDRNAWQETARLPQRPEDGPAFAFVSYRRRSA